MINHKRMLKIYKQNMKNKYLYFDITSKPKISDIINESLGLKTRFIMKELVSFNIKEAAYYNENGQSIGIRYASTEIDGDSVYGENYYLIHLSKHINEDNILRVLDHEIMHLLFVKIKEYEANDKFDILDTYDEPWC